MFKMSIFLTFIFNNFISFAGVIFVVDSADKERLHEAKEELYNIIKSHEISPNVPVLVFANKQDLPGKLV